jgi:hypothetical protein
MRSANAPASNVWPPDERARIVDRKSYAKKIAAASRTHEYRRQQQRMRAAIHCMARR